MALILNNIKQSALHIPVSAYAFGGDGIPHLVEYIENAIALCTGDDAVSIGRVCNPHIRDSSIDEFPTYGKQHPFARERHAEPGHILRPAAGRRQAEQSQQNEGSSTGAAAFVNHAG